MYAFIRGKLVETNEHSVVVDVNGVGYLLFIPSSSLSSLPTIGHELSFYTSFVVREMAMNLYGFLTKEERDLFELLLTISGIGPKTSLSLISHLGPSALSHAILSNDPLRLTKVPGIGKKSAERLIMELKGKIDHFATSLPQGKSPDKIHEALSALMTLGYTQKAAEKALHQVMAENPDENELATLISQALKKSYK